LNYEVTLFPLNDPLTPTTLEVYALVLRTACGLLSCKFLKFHERVISALKFELSGKQNQILVVNSCE